MHRFVQVPPIKSNLFRQHRHFLNISSSIARIRRNFADNPIGIGSNSSSKLGAPNWVN